MRDRPELVRGQCFTITEAPTTNFWCVIALVVCPLNGRGLFGQLLLVLNVMLVCWQGPHGTLCSRRRHLVSTALAVHARMAGRDATVLTTAA